MKATKKRSLFHRKESFAKVLIQRLLILVLLDLDISRRSEKIMSLSRGVVGCHLKRPRRGWRFFHAEFLGAERKQRERTL